MQFLTVLLSSFLKKSLILFSFVKNVDLLIPVPGQNSNFKKVQFFSTKKRLSKNIWFWYYWNLFARCDLSLFFNNLMNCNIC